jgi:hypothetical protein
MKDYQTRLTEYLTTSKAALLARIGKEKALSDELVKDLKATSDAFKAMWN